MKLAESVVLIEFIADLYPDANLRPEDPELCARARLFITLSHDTLHHAFRGFFFRGERIESVLPSLEAFQALLAPSGFAIGPWSMADAVVAPMIVRFMRLATYEIGKYPMGEGKRLLKALSEPRFARFMRYYQSLWERPSVRTTWDEVCLYSASRRLIDLTRLLDEILAHKRQDVENTPQCYPQLICDRTLSPCLRYLPHLALAHVSCPSAQIMPVSEGRSTCFAPIPRPSFAPFFYAVR